ncbi:Sec-independent protein translocase protein TatB [Hyphomonas sp. BRH_c22]|uniref:Sec-independent protein translocase protein TatB n=1 Tax=Hyphomonas sp. BRH_c22 TaxID=1629710 RepID=UPI000AE55DA3|nr:Sec-independent protein translocase protein TatB [Hyphomonas sp. BRH_c22]
MLPGVGFSELLLLALAALIIVGPKDLPFMMRKLGQMVGKARGMAREFQAAFEDIARQSELEDLRKEIEDLKRNNAMTAAQDDLANMESDINAAVMRKEAAEAETPQAEPKSKDDAA